MVVVKNLKDYILHLNNWIPKNIIDKSLKELKKDKTWERHKYQNPKDSNHTFHMNGDKELDVCGGEKLTYYKELMKLISLDASLKEVKTDYCGGDIHGLKYLARKYSANKVTFVPYKEADYIIMIDTLDNNVNNKSSCFKQRPGKDIVFVDRLGVKLSVLRKLEK